jgi:hypothetical protein
MDYLASVVPFALILIFAVGVFAVYKGRQKNRKASPTVPAETLSSATKTIPYFDAFFGLAKSLSRSLSLSDWATGIPQGYTIEETESIEVARQARSRLRYTTASRFVEEPLQRLICEIGLLNWAREDRVSSYDEWGPDMPAESLESITSAFLKAWLCNSNPFVLLELAEFLAETGRISEASEAVEVAMKFPSYAETMTMSEMESVAQLLAYELFPPGINKDAHLFSQGLFSPKTLALLSEETERIQDKLKELETEGGDTEEEQSAGIDDRLDPNQNPDPERLKQLWEAWEQEGEAGILNALMDRQKPPSLPKTDVPREEL